MRIREMFYKDICRDIKGVIKIGQEDDSNVYQELDEYVVTRELNRHFSDFFDAYNRSLSGLTDKMGVWISGFFGSGKSHFLKILSYQLGNRIVNGKRATDYFNDKIEDSMVLADMKRAGETCADIILFNIDSKSEADMKTNKDAIVKVFMRVFNDMQEFCGIIPWVAELERQMSLDGAYENFKQEFEKVSGRKWVEAREDFYYEEDAMIAALAASTKMSEDAARNWYHKAEDNYVLTVDKFAKRVREYIESRGRNHHVVFCVDEVGQYVGDNSSLMLNLQTVVEDLGTECGGKAWVIVTSQQDIDSVTKVRGNDFSKILGRFNTRISLSSANVDEVIRKRLLAKTPVSIDTLRLLFDGKSAVIKNLITFSADTPEKKFYADSQDFAEVYPFIPYQFNLMQQVLTSVREHGSSGKHLAEGERSMISSFQESAMRFADDDQGILIPFSAFFDTIEAFLDSTIRTVIIHAADNANLDGFDVELLKVLFLIRYVKEIPSNIENLATLMVRHIDEDKIDLKKKIEESLKRLVKETLVQKNGDLYIFLTHEEQDINRVIKNISVNIADIIQSASEIIFDDIFAEKKFKYSAHYNFAFNQFVDDRAFRGNQANDLGIKIITPCYDTGSELTQLAFKDMAQKENNLIINLPADTAFLNELEEILKIQAYLLKNGGMASSQTVEDIKTRKGREVNDRKIRVRSLLIDALQNAEIYASAQKLEIREKSPVERINLGLKVLVDSIYTKLNYITDFIESPNDLSNILTQEALQMAIEDHNKLALEELSSFIERNSSRHIPVTIKSVTGTFHKAPYGWNEDDIKGLIAKLFKTQEIRLQLNGDYLHVADKELVRYLTRREYAEKLLIEKRPKISQALINAAKDMVRDTFGKSALPDDEDGLLRRIKKFMEDECAHINTLLENYKYASYPGREVLDGSKGLFVEVLKIKDTKEFFEELQKRQDALLDYGDRVQDVKKFFDPEGKQKEIFDKALRMVDIYQKNKTYVLDQTAIDVYGQMVKIVESKEPYSDIFRLPELIEKFREIFTGLLEQECGPVKQVIVNDYDRVKEELAAYEVAGELGPKIKKGYDDLLDRINRVNNFYEAIAMKEESDRLKQRYIREIIKEAEKKKELETEKNAVGGSEQKKPEKKVRVVSIANLFHGIGNIETRADLERLLAEIQKRLESELQEATIIKFV